jgi:hypothetical protein
MVLADMPKLNGWRIQIVASDIARTTLDKAQTGVYTMLEVGRGLPARALAQHFERVGTSYRVQLNLRSMIEWKQLNLAGPWPIMPRPDIVFLRNVMIYLDMDTRRSILSNIAKNLAQDGYLFLGPASRRSTSTPRSTASTTTAPAAFNSSILHSDPNAVRDNMPSTEHDLLATEDILTLTQEVWASILDIPIEITQPESLSGMVLVSGAVEIDGPWSGTVTVACSPRLATMITAQMFEVAPAEASHDDIVDAVGEIANMIGGNVKALPVRRRSDSERPRRPRLSSESGDASVARLGGSSPTANDSS